MVYSKEDLKKKKLRRKEQEKSEDWTFECDSDEVGEPDWKRAFTKLHRPRKV